MCIRAKGLIRINAPKKLVELISGLQTTPETLDRARAFAEDCGKGKRSPLRHSIISNAALVVTTSKDVPGFVSNALLMPFINEVCTRLSRVLCCALTSVSRRFCV